MPSFSDILSIHNDIIATQYTLVETTTYHLAALCHAYWLALAFAAMFTQRELYLCIIAVVYTTETVLWTCLHIGMQHGQHPLETGYPPRKMSFLSEDFTLEVQLAACFMGILVFHVLYYTKGSSHIGAKSTIVGFGVITPLVLTVVGANTAYAPILRYVLYYAIGFLSGVWRGAMIMFLFARRMPLVNTVLRNPIVSKWTNIHDSILEPLMTTPTDDQVPRADASQSPSAYVPANASNRQKSWTAARLAPHMSSARDV